MRTKKAKDTHGNIEHSSHILGKKKNNNYQGGGQALAWDAQRKRAISIMGDVQDLPGDSLEQPGLVRHVLSRLEVPSNLNDDSVVLITAWCLFPKVMLILPRCSRSDTDQLGSCIKNNLDVLSKSADL